MGSEQSSSIRSDAVDTYSLNDSIREATTIGSSLPSSPQRQLDMVSSRGLGSIDKSLSTSVPNRSLASISRLTRNVDKQASVTISPSQLPRASSTITLSFSARSEASDVNKVDNISEKRGTKEIVVVCQGPRTNLRTSSCFDLRDSGGLARTRELRQLKRLPTFDPFLPTTVVGTRLAQDTGDRQPRKYSPIIPELKLPEILQLVSHYSIHLHKQAESVHKQQLQLFGLQNKVDYELRRVLKHLTLRGKGSNHGQVSWSPVRKLATITDPKKTHINMTHSDDNKINEVHQVDVFVLQTSQITGLLDQCLLMVDQLKGDLNKLNESLPEEKRLPHLG